MSLNPGPGQSSYSLSFKLAFANIHSIKNKASALEFFVDQSKPVVFALSETWFTVKEIDGCLKSVTAKGFTLLHKPHIGKSSGGVGIMTRSNLNAVVHDSQMCKTF